MPSYPLNVVYSLALFLGILVIGYSMTRPLVRYLPDFADPREGVLMRMALGLGMLAGMVALLGFVGLFSKSNVIGLVAVLALLSLAGMRNIRFDAAGVVRRLPALIRRGGVLGLGVGLLLVMPLANALVPPADYDTLMYHLPALVRYFESGEFVLLPEMWQANGPMLVQILFALGLAFGSEALSQLIHLGYAVLLLGAVVSLKRRLEIRTLAWLEPAMMVGVPVYLLWAAWGYVDFAWALYEFLALYCLIVWDRREDRRWLVLGAVFAGLALGVKMVSLGSLAILVGVVAALRFRQSPRRALRAAGVYGAVAALIGASWYLKNLILAGNPVYPFVLGGPGWPLDKLTLLNAFLHSFGTGNGLLDFLTLPVSLTFKHEVFSTWRGVEVPNPILLLALGCPFLRKKRGMDILALYGLARIGLWFVTSQQLRFLLPVLPVAALLAGGTVESFLERGRAARIVLYTSVISMVVISLIYQGIFFLSSQPIPVLSGRESPRDFLLRRVSDFEAIEYINRSLPADARVFLMWDGRSYYCEERCLPDSGQLNWTYEVLRAGFDLDRLLEQLGDPGVTHLLLSEGDVSFMLLQDPTGVHRRALVFFREVFEPACARAVFGQPGMDEAVVYEITCSHGGYPRIRGLSTAWRSGVEHGSTTQLKLLFNQ